VAEETTAGRRFDLDDLLLLRANTERGSLDRWSAAEALQCPEEEAAEKLMSLRERGHLMPHGRGRGTVYRLARHLSDSLRGTIETYRDLPLDDEAVRLRVQAVLSERVVLRAGDGRRSREGGLRLPKASRTWPKTRGGGPLAFPGLDVWPDKNSVKIWSHAPWP
jgi:hypothetical protein